MAVNLMFASFQERAVNTDIMVFNKDYVWFKNFNIHYNIGVDGISVALILLTAIVVLAGVFISWQTSELPKEFFISLIVLSLGVHGVFISIDLFTLFVFFEIAVIPMYLLIGIWGSGPREYSAMKLTLMLMGASAVLLVGILGIYFNSNADGGALTFNILDIAQVHIPLAAQKLFFSIRIYRICGYKCLISISYLVTRWSCFSANSGVYVTRRSFNEIRGLWRV